MQQLNLLETAIVDCYQNASTDDRVSNSMVYRHVESALGVPGDVTPVGKSGVLRNVLHRKIRWAMQDLKLQGAIEKVSRGHWTLTKQKRVELHSIEASQHMVAASTSLGVAIWAKSQTVFSRILTNEPIHLALTSPPYPLNQPRAYGNHKEIQDYIDFICDALSPIVEKLYDGGNIALNIGNDIFTQGTPARSTYVERLVIAIEDRLGLSLMDRLVWSCPNKIPGPIAWASKKRMQLNAGFEPVLWFCNNPNKCIADNRRVLQPHSEAHQRFIESGGQKRRQVNGDGAYIKRAGAFSNATEGKIPKNVLTFHNVCSSGRKVSQYAKENGWPAHSAKMPLTLADFLVKFLSRDGDLVVDPFGGTMTTGQAAEQIGRAHV